jgi:RNA recognition motif-containing protein
MASTDGRRVYVGSLAKDVSKADLEDLFTKFGTIESLWIAKKPAGFAFVVRHSFQFDLTL